MALKTRIYTETVPPASPTLPSTDHNRRNYQTLYHYTTTFTRGSTPSPTAQYPTHPLPQTYRLALHTLAILHPFLCYYIMYLTLLKSHLTVSKIKAIFPVTAEFQITVC